MFHRISTGWEIVRQSWSVLRRDKEMMLFPVLSGLATVMVLASFALPLILVPSFRHAIGVTLGDDSRFRHADLAANAFTFIVSFAYYFANYFVIVFFNTALAACAVIRFKGGDPTVGDGLRAAGARMPQILGWTLVASTVGVILNMISGKSEWLGNIVVAIVGTVWTIATYLVVPTLAVEGLGPVAALKRSARLIASAWGEGLTGNLSIGLIGFLLALPVIPIIGIAVFLGVHNMIALMLI